MKNFADFMSAALPWIAMGLLLAIFFARAARGKKDKDKKKQDRVSEGMALGMCFGVALGTALHIDVGLGLMAGMVLGLLAGTAFGRLDPDREGGNEDE